MSADARARFWLALACACAFALRPRALRSCALRASRLDPHASHRVCSVRQVAFDLSTMVSAMDMVSAAPWPSSRARISLRSARNSSPLTPHPRVLSFASRLFPLRNQGASAAAPVRRGLTACVLRLISRYRQRRRASCSPCPSPPPPSFSRASRPPAQVSLSPLRAPLALARASSSLSCAACRSLRASRR